MLQGVKAPLCFCVCVCLTFQKGARFFAAASADAQRATEGDRERTRSALPFYLVPSIMLPEVLLSRLALLPVVVLQQQPCHHPFNCARVVVVVPLKLNRYYGREGGNDERGGGSWTGTRPYAYPSSAYTFLTPSCVNMKRKF